ncbi:venom acid phosphatase Acph-1-like [Leptopilina heterotoma]|uniref:venom acid phosphatase Acph-1-like n=1 Tax=Leptopilina heterotoma TaxID=63436 RepID=UPI001CA8FECC|nr:venom acid phosphatase Acph-1-like [Leptopilina heterotoma]
MKLYFISWGLLLIAICISCEELSDSFALPKNFELKMVNALFRHGDRTPHPFYYETYPKDPFANETYFPMGYGALTNKGKLRAFELGTFLRRRYNQFLGTTYIPEDIYARSTQIDRAQMTLLLVLAALYPPDALQKWEPTLNWQPIPITYEKADDDVLLFARKCPKFMKMFEEIEKLDEVKQLFVKYEPLATNLTKLTGKNVNSPSEIFNFFNLLDCQESMNLSYPIWAKETLLANKDFQEAVDVLEKMRNYNNALKKLNGGRLLNQITSDMVAKQIGMLKQGTKIKFYSAHDFNVNALIYALGVTEFKRPFYCSAVILEMYSDEKNNYYVQILYYHGDTKKVEILEIPNCSSMCEFNKYQESIKNVVPIKEKLECCDNGLEHCSLNIN